MKLHILVAAPVVALATLVAAGTAQAAPAAPSNELHYTVTRDTSAVVFATSDGKLVSTGNQLQLTDKQGRVAASFPLTYRLNNMQYPITATISGNHARLTPQRAGGTPAADVVRPEAVVSPQQAAAQQAAAMTPQQVGAAALGTLVQQLTSGSITGAMLGGLVGATVGCLGGAALMATVTTPFAWLLGVGPIAGCVAGAASIAAVGTLAGTVFVGAPVAIISLIQYFQATHA